MRGWRPCGLPFMFLIACGNAWGACGGSSPTWTAADTSYTEVSACVTAASAGDTINVPAGSSTWSSTLALTKGLRLIGAGSGCPTACDNATHITANVSNMDLITYVPANYSLNTPLEITGFTFQVGSGAGMGNDFSAIVLGNSNNPQAPFQVQTQIRIHHNRFTGGASDTGGWMHALMYRGGMYGVIDNNKFDTLSYFMRNANPADGADYWQNTATTGFAWVFGDQYKPYFEDNIFEFGTAWTSANNLTNCQWSGRYAFRYNTITMQRAGWSLFDLHGIQGDNLSDDMFSCFGNELYGNYITSSPGGNFVQHRGGKSVVLYNVIGATGLVTSAGAVICPTTFDIETQMVTDTYYWQNRAGFTGSTKTASRDDGGINCGGHVRPLRGTDFFDDSSSPGVGCGTLASRPATCTTNQGYWATTQSCSDLTDYVGQNPTTPISGTFYKCTSTDTWTEFFTPYTYPHPLRNEGGAPDAPTNFRLISWLTGGLALILGAALYGKSRISAWRNACAPAF